MSCTYIFVFLQMLLIQISDQEPEFHSLVREARQMYIGSKEQRLLFEKLKTLCSPRMITEHVEASPGAHE